jgi:hypothetical protein
MWNVKTKVMSVTTGRLELYKTKVTPVITGRLELYKTKVMPVIAGRLELYKRFKDVRNVHKLRTLYAPFTNHALITHCSI